MSRVQSKILRVNLKFATSFLAAQRKIFYIFFNEFVFFSACFKGLHDSKGWASIMANITALNGTTNFCSQAFQVMSTAAKSLPPTV